MKKAVSLLIVLALLALLSVPAFADGYRYVIDETGNLTNVDELNALAQSIYEQSGVAFCYAAADLETGDDANEYVDANFLVGETVPDAPVILLIDGGDSVYTRGRNLTTEVLTEEQADALSDAYLNAGYYSEGAKAYYEKAASFYVIGRGAETSTTGAPNGRANAALRRMVDGAGLLTSGKADQLDSRLYEISDAQDCDVVIVTVNGLDGKTPEEYADDYFDYNGYGVGDEYSGILFLISMADRDWAISTHGFGIVAFTDYGQEEIMSEIMPDLSGGDYAAAFTSFADCAEEYLQEARDGDPIDRPSTDLRQSVLYNPVGIVIILLIALLLAGIPLGKLKNEINNVKFKSGASDYVRQGSLQIVQSYDNFLYSNTTQVRIQTESSSSTRSSGGSSTHVSSSGRTHGGSSGKF